MRAAGVDYQGHREAFRAGLASGIGVVLIVLGGVGLILRAATKQPNWAVGGSLGGAGAITLLASCYLGRRPQQIAAQVAAQVAARAQPLEAAPAPQPVREAPPAVVLQPQDEIRLMRLEVGTYWHGEKLTQRIASASTHSWLVSRQRLSEIHHQLAALCFCSDHLAEPDPLPAIRRTIEELGRFYGIAVQEVAEAEYMSDATTKAWEESLAHGPEAQAEARASAGEQLQRSRTNRERAAPYYAAKLLERLLLLDQAMIGLSAESAQEMAAAHPPGGPELRTGTVARIEQEIAKMQRELYPRDGRPLQGELAGPILGGHLALVKLELLRLCQCVHLVQEPERLELQLRRLAESDRPRAHQEIRYSLYQQLLAVRRDIEGRQALSEETTAEWQSFRARWVQWREQASQAAPAVAARILLNLGLGAPSPLLIAP